MWKFKGVWAVFTLKNHKKCVPPPSMEKKRCFYMAAWIENVRSGNEGSDKVKNVSWIESKKEFAPGSHLGFQNQNLSVPVYWTPT